MQALNYLWRLCMTILSFVVFGFGGLLISILAYPVLLIFVRDSVKRSHYGQYLIHICFKYFTGLMKIVGIFSITVTGIEKLDQQGMFIITNHPTLIDVVILLSLLKRSDCVVKGKLMDSPFTRGPLKVASYIVNSNPDQLIDSCVEALNKNHNLLMFPEGTRTKNTSELKFKRGAAKIAIRAQKDLTTIIIKCQPRMLAKGYKWYRVPKSKPHFTIEVGNKVLIQDFLDLDKSENIQSRKLNDYLVNYFKEELHIA